MKEIICAPLHFSDCHRFKAVALAPFLARANAMWLRACLNAFLAGFSACGAETNSTAEAEAAYTRTIHERADKIVATLNLADMNKTLRVRDTIARQYRSLSQLHDDRNLQVWTAKENARLEKKPGTNEVQQIEAEFRTRLDKLHREFLAKLSAELSPAQVDQVKDGMTYGVLPLTYGVYLKMYPDLTEEQKAQIKTWLTEARELAMDGSTSDEKHAVFGKYKGKINNYLSKAGYDAKKAEQNLRKPAAPAPGVKAK